MRASMKHYPLLIGGVVALLMACDSERKAEDQVLAALVEQHHCTNLEPELSPADSALTDREACSLVAGAIKALGATPASAGLPAGSDTGLVVGASITSMMEETVSGEPVGSWWVVTLSLAEKAYDVDVRISKADGETELFVVHK